MKKQFIIKQLRTDKFLIYEIDSSSNKILVNDTCRYQYEIDKFIELNNGIIIEYDMLEEIKKDSDKRGLLFG